MNELEVQPRSPGRAPGDQYARSEDARALTVPEGKVHELDGQKARDVLKQLLTWFYWERERSAENRLQMAMDCDFYDGLQWDPEDSEDVQARGQMPLVYNEIAPMVDWLIGTERRTRVDWKVLPRTEDDVQLADVKTKVLKYVSDVNNTVFVRSRAFADAVKAGVGWIDSGARDDPTKDVLYDKYEDWRNVLYDSRSYELSLEDARYVFRWRWVDEDVATLMFPDRADEIRRALDRQDGFTTTDPEEDALDGWGGALSRTTRENGNARPMRVGGVGIAVDTQRRRVRLIEAQYRMPMQVKIVADGAFKGAILNPHDQPLMDAVAREGAPIIDKQMMRVCVAVFTEASMLAMGPSGYRHNDFSLTPVFCYRRGRDRMPYGVIRRVRDVQQDLNKRASKALFYLNSNQLIVDDGAVEDIDEARDEANRPDGVIVKKAGKEVLIRRDTDAATGQIQMMAMDGQTIQKSAGVADENLGRQTNAVSGEAIKARQNQGSVVMTEPFDNLRMATQTQGQKQLSLTEQFYTEEKVIRLTGAKGALEWVKLNVPEVGPDGQVRFLNDITSSMADFIVSEQDYNGTLRQVMFDSLNQIAQRLPPEVSLRLLTMAFEFSDLPNKDEIADQIRRMTGERDPNKELTPEEQQQAQEQAMQQAEAMQMQRETAMAALGEAQARVREINAKAQKLEAEAAAAGGDGGQGAEMARQFEEQLRQVQSQAADQIDALAEQLRKAQGELANRTMQIDRDADVQLQLADIERDKAIQVAEIQKVSDAAIERLMKTIDGLQAKFENDLQDLKTVQKEDAAKAKEATPAPAPEPKPAPAPAPVAPPVPDIHLTVNVDATGTEGEKTVHLLKDASGKVTGAEVKPAGKAKPKGGKA